MSKERLSKLQKWILIRCYKSSYKLNDGTYFMRRKWIFSYFKHPDDFKFYNYKKRDFTPQEYSKINATITRSIKNLRQKGFINEYERHPLKRGYINLKENGISAMGECMNDTGYIDRKEAREEVKQDCKQFHISFPEYTTGIGLTDKGMKKAIELLNVNFEQMLKLNDKKRRRKWPRKD